MGKNKKKNKKPKSDNCPRCKGKGEVVLKEELPNGGIRSGSERCSLCYGSGKH